MEKTDSLQTAGLTERKRIIRDSGTVLVLLLAIGAGSFDKLFGSRMETLSAYAATIFELGVMLLASGDSFYEIRLLNLERRYLPCYEFLLYLVLDSMVVSSDKSGQLVTCIHLSVTVIFAIWLSKHYSVEKLLLLLIRAQGLYILLTFLFLAVNPSGAFLEVNGENSFVGLMSTKNEEASELSFGIAMELAMLLIYRREHLEIRRRHIALFVLQLALLPLCRATSSFLITAVILIYEIVWWRSVTHPRANVGLIYIVISVGFLTAAMTILPVFEPLFNLIGKDATLTGRTLLWGQLINVLSAHHTFFGYGYTMFWRDEEAVMLLHQGFSSNSFFGQMATGSHNDLLELWGSIGLVGILFYFVMLLRCSRDVSRLSDQKYLVFSTYIFLFLLGGLTERKWRGTYEYNILFLFYVLGLALDRTYRKWKRHIDPAVQEIEKQIQMEQEGELEAQEEGN